MCTGTNGKVMRSLLLSSGQMAHSAIGYSVALEGKSDISRNFFENLSLCGQIGDGNTIAAK